MLYCTPVHTSSIASENVHIYDVNQFPFCWLENNLKLESLGYDLQLGLGMELSWT